MYITRVYYFVHITNKNTKNQILSNNLSNFWLECNEALNSQTREWIGIESLLYNQR